MNLPDNLSTVANRIFSILSVDQSPQTAAQLAEAYTKQPASEERHKAIATADSLVIKGILSADKGTGETTYTLIKTSAEVGPDDEADAKEDYVEKTDANAEEKRMIAILESNDQKLSENKLFDLYEKEQLPANGSAPAGNEEIEKALQELTAAGAISKEGEAYSIIK